MSFVTPLPPEKVWIRAEYLYDFKRGHGELVPAVWVSLKSIRGQAFRFESYLPEYGALYDKLPISAYVWHDVLEEDEQLMLDELQIWDCLSYHAEVIDKPLLKGLRCEFFGKSKRMHAGEYMFCIDQCNPDPRIPDLTFSEGAEEHKSFNVLKLDNGQFALQPNNRLRVFDPALSHAELKQPDFHVSTRVWRVENQAKWRLGDTTTVSYDGRGDA